MKTMITALAFLALASATRAEVVEAHPNGFEVRQVAVVETPANVVWATLLQPSKWWSSSHTWSGSAANLSLAAASGGCFCERLPNGGSVLHMTTVHAVPNQKLVLTGGLGPLQSSGASGALAVQLAETAGRTTVTFTYDVGGWFRGGLDKVATPVDGVLGEQVLGLKRAAEAN